MNKLGKLLLTVALLGGLLNAGELSTEQQKTGYALGLVLSQQAMQLLGPALKKADLTAVGQGLTDGLENFINDKKEVKLSDEEIKQLLEKINTEIKAEVESEQAALQKQVADNTVASNKFLEENKKKPNVKTTTSGLQYIVVKEGTGAAPKNGDTVSVHYIGKLTDGKEFDSSVKRDEPFEFEYPGQVIPGWNEALSLLKSGGKITVFLPPALAYGDYGAPPAIPPATVLVFDIELLKVTSPAASEK